MQNIKKYFMTLALLLTAVTGAWAQSTEPTEWELTSKDDKKVWTLTNMPANNIELQVEYYAESNIFLGKEALANKANISVLNGSTAVTFDDEGKSANTVTEGNTVTVTYTGTKKIIGVKAEKKAAAKTLAEATSEDIGKIAGKDGNIYATKADAEAVATGNAVAMIAYVGTASDCTHGLAIALADESGKKDYGAAGTACSGKAAVTGGTWRLPSIKDWQYMFIGCGASGSYSATPTQMSCSEFASKLTTAQGNALQTAHYWSSTEISTGSLAWNMVFDVSRANFIADDEYREYPVRACLAF